MGTLHRLQQKLRIDLGTLELSDALFNPFNLYSDLFLFSFTVVTEHFIEVTKLCALLTFSIFQYKNLNPCSHEM